MAEITIESREELIYLLSEAAEVEHGVACSYLFAAFSMKSDVSEGVSEEQLAAIERWRGVLIQVAGQEMAHLTLASNMLTAIGAAPQLRRPNFPAGSGYYPEGFALVATPFNEETLQHFLFIERPEGMAMDDGAVYRSPGQPHPDPVVSSDVTPEPRAFATIGELYHAIEDGFRHLCDKLGAETVFIGPPKAQATSEYFSFDEVLPVVDLASAIEAIETIVEEGEGTRGEIEGSHYGRFLAIQEEYHQMLADDPAFTPARPVLENPFTRVPSDSPDVNVIDDPFSVELCDLFDDCYEVLLQMLARFFAHTDETPAELKALADIAVDVMFVAIVPLGNLITTLPAGPSHPGLNAGPGFHFFRTLHTLPHRHAAWLIFMERLAELSRYAAELGDRPNAPAILASVAGDLDGLRGKLADAMQSTA